jgi:hypothetical protein
MNKLFAYALLMLFCSVSVAANKSPAIKTRRVVTIFGLGCHIAATIPVSLRGGIGNGGEPDGGSGGVDVKPLPKSWKSSLEALYLNLYCNDNDMEARSKGTISKYDSAHHEWVKDLHRAYPQFTDQELKEIDGATSVLNIQARNSSGYVSFQRDTTGDESGRTKVVDFCLFHETRALCGTGTVAQLIDGARGDLTKQTLDIIKSIEFLDDEEPVHLSPGASEPSH